MLLIPCAAWSQYDAALFGVTGNGTTDDSAAMLALATLISNSNTKGGTIQLPVTGKKTVINSQIITCTGAPTGSCWPVNVHIKGCGGEVSDIGTFLGPAGCGLALNYSGTGDTNGHYKWLFYGTGETLFDNVAITTTAGTGDCNPFFFVGSGYLRMIGGSMIGSNASNAGSLNSCNNAIQFGVLGSAGDNSHTYTDRFYGYWTWIHNVGFANMQQIFLFGAAANGIDIQNIGINGTNGCATGHSGTTPNCSFIVFNAASAADSYGNFIYHISAEAGCPNGFTGCGSGYNTTSRLIDLDPGKLSSGTCNDPGNKCGFTTLTCTDSTTVTLSGFNKDGSGATATVPCHPANQIANGAALTVTSGGTGYTSAPTTVSTCSMGTGPCTATGTGAVSTAVSGTGYASYNTILGVDASDLNSSIPDVVHTGSTALGNWVQCTDISKATRCLTNYNLNYPNIEIDNANQTVNSRYGNFVHIGNDAALNDITFGGPSAVSTLSSAATSNNTVKLPAVAPTNGDLLYCAISGTTCTLTDTGVSLVGGVAKDVVSIYTGTANTDLAGKITASGGTATYTFAGVYAAAPVCIVQDDTTISHLASKTVSSSMLTVTTTGMTDVVSYICVIRN
jgi:hypothetical protein